MLIHMRFAVHQCEETIARIRVLCSFPRRYLQKSARAYVWLHTVSRADANGLSDEPNRFHELFASASLQGANHSSLPCFGNLLPRAVLWLGSSDARSVFVHPSLVFPLKPALS